MQKDLAQSGWQGDAHILSATSLSTSHGIKPMSLEAVRQSFPNEVTPTHYEVRQRQHTAYETLPMGHVIGVGAVDNVVHGQHDNLHDAFRQQAAVELNRVNPDHSPDPERLDRFATTLGPTLGMSGNYPHPARPSVYAVYPDGSYKNVDHMSRAFYADGTLHNSKPRHQSEEAATTGTIRPAPQAHQPGSQHQSLIGALARIGRDMNLAFTHSDAKATRDAALRNHDLTAALAAADAGEEQGRLHPDEAEEVRQHVRDSGMMPYSSDRNFIRSMNNALKY